MSNSPMHHDGQATKLLSLIAHGLIRHGARQTHNMLGDRASYVGLSDIGRGLECMRAAVASKHTPHVDIQADDVLAILRRQLILQRGHCFEELVGQALEAVSLNLLEHLEIDITHQGTPIKAHFDFVLASASPKPTVRILECKSTKRLPETLYAAYECQVHGQVGLLQAYWRQQVFSLKDATGNVVFSGMTFPEICQAHCGLILPSDPEQVDMQAWVLALSMTDAKVFGPYLFHPAMLRLCFKIAEAIWRHLQECQSGISRIDSLPTASGCHPLCAYCDWNVGCPKFKGLDHPDWKNDLEALLSFKRFRKDLDEKIEEKEEAIKAAYACLSGDGKWVHAGPYQCKVTQQSGRRSLDKDRLRQELTTLLGDQEEADHVFAQCHTQGQPSDRLIVQDFAVHATGRQAKTGKALALTHKPEAEHVEYPV